MHHASIIASCVLTQPLYCSCLPYSPDLDLTKPVFAETKALPREAEARGSNQLNTALGALLDHFQPNEFVHYFRSVRYQSA